MVRRKKLWIFGQSQSTPFRLSDKKTGWDNLLSRKLNVPFENHGQPGADNFYIYYTLLENLKRIKSGDIVVIGWSHPSRKTFVVDHKNNVHKNLLDGSIVYKNKRHHFMRNNSAHTETFPSVFWDKMEPRDSGTTFYDQWYANYYSTTEQNVNFQSYLWSAKNLLSDVVHLNFFFSKESVKHIKVYNSLGHALEFGRSKKATISKRDYHFNELGHRLWANRIYRRLKNEIK